MEQDPPDLGDTPGFAKALAELKKDVPSGEDPLYFDVTKGARLLTREERQRLFERARKRGQPTDDPPLPDPDPGAEMARLLGEPTPSLTDTLREPVMVVEPGWPRWVRASVTAALLVLLLAGAVRLFSIHASVGGAPASALDAKTPAPLAAPASEAPVVSDVQIPAPRAVSPPPRLRAVPPPSSSAKSRTRHEAAPAEPASGKTLDVPTIDNPDRY
jgi:hypothetical protein